MFVAIHFLGLQVDVAQAGSILPFRGVHMVLTTWLGSTLI